MCSQICLPAYRLAEVCNPAMIEAYVQNLQLLLMTSSTHRGLRYHQHYCACHSLWLNPPPPPPRPI